MVLKHDDKNLLIVAVFSIPAVAVFRPGGHSLLFLHIIVIAYCDGFRHDNDNIDCDFLQTC